jgi:RNA recognition motif-containing protein
MLPKTIDEEDLHNMFAPYGELREVHIIRGPEGSSKGCAFVKFVDRDAAMVAIEDMNDIIPPVIIYYIPFALMSPFLLPLPSPPLPSLIGVSLTDHEMT